MRTFGALVAIAKQISGLTRAELGASLAVDDGYAASALRQAAYVLVGALVADEDIRWQRADALLDQHRVNIIGLAADSRHAQPAPARPHPAGRIRATGQRSG
jgi:hypothetical protein